ncbi:hypothetical protein [Nitrosomonas sp. Nm166]|uniref:hypothetical protein n=1 Tax=Nitrosomonas sp. Nm166 TaxID=1881054 RepID=UPI0008E6C02E|nr:hypothetical protein [Nitrosomonas sp. Nm166]SFD86770.1 hypothetical protein SAMN05428977_1001115 [Nitrosomonas sp. Nm166]
MTKLPKLLVQTILILAIVLTGHHVSAEEVVPISEINTSPANFDGKEVKLRGVARSPTRLPLINLKSYILEDKSGEIMVLTEADLPKMNEEITIRARVKSLAIVKGEALGLTVTELERYEQQLSI